MKRLVLFDFDGTLTTRDTLMAFIRFYHGRWQYFRGLAILCPYLIAYKLTFIPNWKAKERVLDHFFSGEPEEAFDRKCQLFAQGVLPDLLRPTAIKQLAKHQKADDRIIVVSASPEKWILPWTQLQGVELIATRLQIRDGRITGYLSGKNCYGPEKARRISEYLDTDSFDEIVAYGDSKGDREMLSLASRPMFRKFT